MITWEYLAGFIDADGCYGIYTNGARLTIGQKHREVLDAIKEFLNIENKLSVSKNCFYLQISQQGQLFEIIEETLPFMIVKREKALEVRKWLTINPNERRR